MYLHCNWCGCDGQLSTKNSNTDDCTLPRYIALEIEDTKQKDLDNCVKLYNK